MSRRRAHQRLQQHASAAVRAEEWAPVKCVLLSSPLLSLLAFQQCHCAICVRKDGFLSKLENATCCYCKQHRVCEAGYRRPGRRSTSVSFRGGSTWKRTKTRKAPRDVAKECVSVRWNACVPYGPVGGRPRTRTQTDSIAAPQTHSFGECFRDSWPGDGNIFLASCGPSTDIRTMQQATMA